VHGWLSGRLAKRGRQLRGEGACEGYERVLLRFQFVYTPTRLHLPVDIFVSESDERRHSTADSDATSSYALSPRGKIRCGSVLAVVRTQIRGGPMLYTNSMYLV
jgi:hypothetical protein